MGIFERNRRRRVASDPYGRRGNGALPEEAPRPQPERREPELRDPSLTDLSRRDYGAIVVRAGREALADGITDVAAALAYYAFLAIPAALLVAVGLFGLVAGPDAVDSMMERLEGVVPADAIGLLRDSLTRMTENESGGLVMVVLGLLLALWTTTGAMTGLIRGLNRVYDRKETRNFLRQRVTALAMLACMLLAFALSFGLLVLGLLLAFAGVLYLGPNVAHPRWRFLTPGAVFAVVVWLLASGLFAVYVSMFGSYNKAWGSLAAVIVMLTWLWLSALAILFGAEINAEAEPTRELRQGRPAERDLQAPAKA